MSVSLESVDTADFESTGANDFESSDVMKPLKPNPEDMEQVRSLAVERVVSDCSCARTYNNY